MRDLAFYAENLRKDATFQIKYNTPYPGEKASGQLVVLDYTKLAARKASGLITYGEPEVGDTVIVNGTTFTCVASAPESGEFSNIAELEALVEAVTGIDSSVEDDTIIVQAATAGTAGNALTLAVGGGNTGTLAVSGTTLTGGKNAETLTLMHPVDGVLATLTFGVEITVGASNAATATNIASTIDAIEFLEASADGTTVNVNSAEEGDYPNGSQLVCSDNTAVLGATVYNGASGDRIYYTDEDEEGYFECRSAGDSQDYFSDATELTALFDGLTNMSATLDGDVITVTASKPYTVYLGLPPNAPRGDMELLQDADSKPTIVVDEGIYSDYEFFTTPVGLIASSVIGTVAVGEIRGSSGPSVIVTPQVSTDTINWQDLEDAELTLTQDNEIVNLHTTETIVPEGEGEPYEEEREGFKMPLPYLRFRVRMTGTNPTCTFVDIKAFPAFG